MPTTPFLPLPEDLEIIGVREAGNQVEIQVLSHRSRCLCPGCSLPSQAIHSYYRRHPMELPCTGRRVRIVLSVKKFFCHNPDCPRKVFTERIPELIEPSSRLTTRLRALIQAMGVAFNANGGTRLAEQMGVQVSRRTVLFSLHLLPVPPVGQIKRVGIDDFAWKRGVRYGTVLIDLDSHRIIDILADRETESIKQWLQFHPEIEMISRDRGGVYADGAAQGAPQAIQCADRWHLCKNLGDAVESYLKHHPLAIPASTPALETKETVTSASTYEQRRQQRRAQVTFERKQAIVEKVREMHRQGISGHGIAAELHLARGTVRKYLQTEGPIRQTPRTRQPSLLDPHYDYLCQRWNEDTPTALQLFGELQQRGFQGKLSIVKDARYPPSSRTPRHETPTKITDHQESSPNAFSKRVALDPREKRGEAYP
ncbi:MAG: ISL3 family transposase [Ktedonobacteraceae bacterium]|nr:ISL3 family transposase [Ktedonobacteraceae bacterium]